MYSHSRHISSWKDIGGVGDEEARLTDGTIAHHCQLQRARRRLH